MEYIHQSTGEDNKINTISGYYTVDDEKLIKYQGKDILCVIGLGIIDSSCCGVGGCRYAMVPGYVRHWKKKTIKGQYVSEVDPVIDEKSKIAIKKILMEEEIVTQINFW
ncbi:MAG TPA: hypothetical protein DD405_03090 [Desulfobacteraceae bacterium]|nr:hypothetical protein [Desulfobacteraceae bacterium]